MREAGLHEIADDVAFANADFDHRFPGRRLIHSWRHLGPSAWIAARLRLNKAARERDPELLGWALHGIQDYHAHGWLGEKHMQRRLGLLRRDPDDWAAAPSSVRRRIKDATIAYLSVYRGREPQTS